MKDRRPNFLIFCTDQHQSYCLGCNGHAEVRTPNIDAVAREGVTFRRAYCNNSVCMPSRATMVTGLTPRQHGLLTNGCVLSESVPTVTAALAEAGYRTHAAGKLHLQPFGGMGRAEGARSLEFGGEWNSGAIRKLPSPYYGFQTTDYVGGHVSYAFGEYRQWLDAEHPGLHARLGAETAYHKAGRGYRIDMPPELHYNHWIADRAIDFLRGAGEAPFLLFCSFPDPHFPFAACRPYSEMYDPAAVALPPNWQQREDPAEFLRRNRAAYPFNDVTDEAELREIVAQTYGMISHVDDNVGRVLRALSEAGLADNTVVALLADHGEYLGAHGLLHKGPWPWEQLVRVPYVWRVPPALGGRAAGTDGASDPVSILDLVPTICDYAGIGTDWADTRGAGKGERPGLPGRSLRPYLEGRSADPQPAVLEYDEDHHAVVRSVV